MTGAEQVEIRGWGRGGVAYRTVRADAVVDEVAVWTGHGKYDLVEIRAVGADEWRKVA